MANNIADISTNNTNNETTGTIINMLIISINTEMSNNIVNMLANNKINEIANSIANCSEPNEKANNIAIF